MSQYIIEGGKLLTGEIAVKGAKNQAIKMFPAALLCDGPSTFRNVPEIIDIAVMSNIIKTLGGEVTQKQEVFTINPKNISSAQLPVELVTQIRASFLFIIPLLHKFKKVVFPHPGGDAIGRRPIDISLDFLTQMGAKIETQPDAYIISAPKRLKGIEFTFRVISHTGTEALIMAGVLAQGTTTIKNAALEPEVGELCHFLNSVGAKIKGMDTPTITIEGVQKLKGGNATIIPDRIEAGTFAILGALTGKDLTITNIDLNHLDVLLKYFDIMNIAYTTGKNSLKISKAKKIFPTDIKTHEYPGFATDLQPPMTVLMTQAEGQSIMHETIYDGRLFYTDKLNSMGADIIMADPHRVIINGKSQLYGKRIGSPDIRAGIALIMSALIAKGSSEITQIHHIERGHADFIVRMQAIGANISQRNDN